jgi:phage gp37-like protein
MIKQVEDAMLGALRAALGDGSAKPVVKFFDTVPAQLDDAELQRRIRQAPGCFVSFIAGTPRGGQALIIDASFGVYVMTQSDSEADRRRGSKVQAGAYVVLLLVASVLHNFKVPGIGTLLAESVSNLFAEALDEQGVALYAVIFKIPLSVPANRPADIAAFITSYADFLFDKPAPDALLPLPAPGTNDANASDMAGQNTLPQGDD